jgi:hypothetical protein
LPGQLAARGAGTGAAATAVPARAVGWRGCACRTQGRNDRSQAGRCGARGDPHGRSVHDRGGWKLWTSRPRR